MVTLRAAAVLAATFFVLTSACSRPEAGPLASGRPEAASAAADSTPVAEVNGESITWAELDEKAAGPLARVRQEEYEVRSRVLDGLIAQRLLEAAAQERGTTSDELLRQEIERRTQEPSPEQIESVYARAHDRFEGQSRSEALGQIEEALRDRAERQSRLRFLQELREDADVTVRLDAPRVAVDVPPGAPATGSPDAPITIVEFTDYQCPYCHRAQSTIERILDEYEGEVRLVHLDYPLGFHSGAIPAARAARCAGEQGRFWDYHRNLMTHKGALDDADLAGRAASLKLDAGAFGRCLASDRHDAAIHAELELGSGAGVTGTPAYFINGRMVSGARPFSDFADIIDAELHHP
jgi:protein-disulfide isomerase